MLCWVGLDLAGLGWAGHDLARLGRAWLGSTKLRWAFGFARLALA